MLLKMFNEFVKQEIKGVDILHFVYHMFILCKIKILNFFENTLVNIIKTYTSLKIHLRQYPSHGLRRLYSTLNSTLFNRIRRVSRP